MFKINTFYDFDRPNAPWDSLQSSAKKWPALPHSLDKRRVVAPTREKLAKLDDMRMPKYTPEESAKEKARILSVLERVGFDDAMRAYAQAVIQNKYVPKELIMSGMKTMKSEMAIMMEIMQNWERMTEEDQKEIAFATIGGESVLRDMIQALPETVVEIPTNPEGTEIKKISGMTLMRWMPEPLKKLVR